MEPSPLLTTVPSIESIKSIEVRNQPNWSLKQAKPHQKLLTQGSYENLARTIDVKQKYRVRVPRHRK
jgi:hypothetical protein